MVESRVLFLFSSNIRPLYEQDILDLLASPLGVSYRFRYRGSKYLAEDVWKEWENLEGSPVLVHFALQQESQYHEPAFIPVRRGTVARTERLGDVNVIEFTLGEFVSLRKPDDKTQEPWENPAGRVVQQYLTWLKGHSVPQPYRHWAGFGPDPGFDAEAPFHSDNDPMILFEQTVNYLNRTTSFREARFYWITGLYQLGENDDTLDALVPQDGKFVLEGGRTYGLQVAHSQPVDIRGRERFRVSSDGEAVRPIGSGEFEIASRYDMFMLPLHATEPPTSEARETVVNIEAKAGIQAPRIRLHVRVVRSKSRTVAAVSGSAMAGVLLGIPGLWPTSPVQLRMLCVFLATLLLGLLANWGLRRT